MLPHVILTLARGSDFSERSVSHGYGIDAPTPRG